MSHIYIINVMSGHLNEFFAELFSDNDVTELRLYQPPCDTEYLLTGDYGPLLQFIQSSGNLRTLCLDHILDIEVVRLLLNAASMNLDIEQLVFKHMTIPGPVLFNHLQTKLYSSIHMGDITIIDREYLVRLLQACPKMVFGSDVHLHLHQMDDYIITPCLHFFSGYMKLKKLHLATYKLIESSKGAPVEMSGPLSTSISNLLISSSSIECIEFHNYTFTASNLGIIAEGFRRCTSVEVIGIFKCNFNVEASNMFEQMVISPSWKVRSLQIGNSTEFNSITIHRMFHKILNLKPRNSSLKKLKLTCWGNEEFTHLMQPLQEEASIDCLDLGIIYNSHEFSHLLMSLPHLRGLKHLIFILSDHIRQCENYRRNMMFKFEINHCLELISVSWQSTTEGKYEDQQQFDQFCLRNRFVKHWLTTPQAVSDRLLPFIFEKALKYAYSSEIVMKGLMASWMTK
jgi:hypothetical protein